MPSKFTTYSYKEVSELSDLIYEAYKINNIDLSPNSSVMEYINSAKMLYTSSSKGDHALTENKERYFKILENTLECLRLGVALKWVKNKPNLYGHLKYILRGYLDPTSKIRSAAKDFFFELQMLEILQSAGLNADLLEPPDIVLTLDNVELVIACKCAYSQGNLENNFRKARRQIVEAGKKGLIALSIDGLMNHSKLYFPQDEHEFSNLIVGHVINFIKEYERFFPVWIRSRNVIGILVSLSTLTILKQRPSTAQENVIIPLCSENSPYFGKLQKLTDFLGLRRI